MIDFLKASIHPLAFPKEASEAIEWQMVVNERTGEISPWQEYYFGSMKAKGFFPAAGSPTRIILSGSIHKHQQGGANWKPFDFRQLLEGLISISDHLGVSPHEIQLENLEAGANVRTSHRAQEILKGAFLHRSTPFEAMLSDRKYGVVATKSEFRDKLYAKGRQYTKEIETANEAQDTDPEKLIRWERHYSKMRQLNQMGISTFADLANPSRLSKLRHKIEESLNEVLFVPQEKEARSEVATWNKEWTNPRYFISLSRENPQQFRRERTKLNNRLQDAGLVHWAQTSDEIRNELRAICYPSLKDAKMANHWASSSSY